MLLPSNEIDDDDDWLQLFFKMLFHLISHYATRIELQIYDQWAGNDFFWDLLSAYIYSLIIKYSKPV